MGALHKTGMLLDHHSPIRCTQLLFCLLSGLNILRDLSAHSQFYRWFSSCGLKIGLHRGFGQSACRAYGIFPQPPPLSDAQFMATGFALVGCLLASCTDLAPRCMLLSSLVLYWLYYGQLYCEAHVGAHVIVLMPPMLLICAFAPDLTDGSASRQTQMLSILLLKTILVSAYMSAGMSKIWASLKRRKCWWDGATLQYYIFEAMQINRDQSPDGTGLPHWSFGVPTPYSHVLQHWLFSHPRICAILSVKSVLFETLAPIVIVVPALGPYFAIAGLGFHYGISLFQNIDFVTWWGPFYALFIWEDSQITADVSLTILTSLEESPFYSGVVILYLVLHILGCVYAGWTGNEILPFSSFHMFSEPKNLWSKDTNIALWVTDKPHATGTLKNYCFPFCRKQHVAVNELHKLPFKYLLVSRQVDGTRELATNIVLSDKNHALIRQLFKELERGYQSYLDPKAIADILDLQRSMKLEFAIASRSEQVFSLRESNAAAG